MTYYIERLYFSSDVANKVLHRGLTLDEAQAHCRDPETSASTCADPKLKALTKRVGPWFDAYEKE